MRAMHVFGMAACLLALPVGRPAGEETRVPEGAYWTAHPRRPRLLFGPKDVPGLRARLRRKPVSLMWPVLRRRCEEYLTPGSPTYVDWRERRQEFWRTRDGVWRLSQCLPDLAMAYVLSGDPRYGEYARDISLTILREDVEGQARKGIVYGLPYAGWGIGDGGWVHLGMAVALDLAHDLFSPEERRAVAGALASYARRVAQELQPTRPGGERFVSNQSVYPLCHGALCGLAAYGDADITAEELARWVAHAVEESDGYLQHQLDPDGAAFEGPGYADTLTLICQLGWVMRRAGFADDLLSRPRLRRSASYFLHVILPGGGDIQPLGQCFNRMAGDSLLARACADQDRMAQFAWMRYMVPERPDVRLGDAGSYGYLSFLWCDPGLRPASRREQARHLDAHFSGMGLLDVRTGWEAGDFRFCATGGSGFCGGCPDKGSFTLCADGERYGVDIGYGALGAERHCSVLIDGKGAPLGLQVRERTVEHSLQGPVKFGRIDLTRSYQGSERVSRSFAVAKPGGRLPWHVLVMDDLRMPAGEHDFEWILVSAPGSRVSQEGPGVFRVQGREHAMALQVAMPEGIEAATDVIEHRYMREDTKTPTSEPGDFPRLRLKARGTACRFLVLLCPWDRRPDVARADTTTHVGVKLAWGDRAETLRFQREPIPGQPSFAARSR